MKSSLRYKSARTSAATADLPIGCASRFAFDGI